MEDQRIDVYISDNNTECERLVDFLQEADISFSLKNTTENKQHLTDLQKNNIFITPAIIIDDHYQVIGFQPDKIRRFLRK